MAAGLLLSWLMTRAARFTSTLALLPVLPAGRSSPAQGASLAIGRLHRRIHFRQVQARLNFYQIPKFPIDFRFSLW